jgi:hypothetical protein
VRARERAARARDDLERVLSSVTVGTSERNWRMPRLELAQRNLDSWQAANPPPYDRGAVGGSSSPAEVDDRREEAALRAQLSRDATRIPELVYEIERLTRDLYALVARYTETVHPDRLPKQVIPGCESCARTTKHRGRTLGGHFAPTWDRTTQPLCRFCYGFARDSAQGQPITSSHWPPLEAVDLYHRQSPQAAGRYLARSAAQRVS